MKTTLIESSSIADEQVLTSDALAAKNNIECLQFPLSFNTPSSHHPTCLSFMFTKRNKGEVNIVEAVKKDALQGKFSEELNAIILLPWSQSDLPIVQIQNDQGGSASVLADLVKDFGNIADVGGGIADYFDAGAEHVKAEVATKFSKVTNNSLDTGQVTQGRERGSSYASTKKNTYSFNWRFYPKSVTELKMLGQIIKTFATLSSAGSGGVVSGSVGGVEYNADQTLKISTPGFLWVEEIPLKESVGFTPRLMIGPCGVTNFKVYQPADMNDARFYGSTDQVCYQIELEVQEITPRFRDDWQAICANLGVDVGAGSAGFSQYKNGQGK